MKKLLKSNLLLILITTLLFGCSDQKEGFFAPAALPSIEEGMPSEGLLLRSGNGAIALPEADRAIIASYCNDLKTLAFESHAMTAEALNYNSYKEVPVEEILRNPMIPHLQFLNIKEESTNNSIRFYDLSLEDREEFLNAYLKEEQRSIEEKVALIPELLAEIEEYDLVCKKIFSDRNVERLDYETMAFSKFSTAGVQSARTIKRHSPSTKAVDLFDLIEEELAPQNTDHGDISNDLSQTLLRGSSSGSARKNERIRRRVISKHLESGARKGDILIRKKCLIIGKKFSIGGHAAIINFPLHWNSQEGDDLSIDATPKDKKAGYSDGVQHMKFKTWYRPHAVLGIRRTITHRSRKKRRGRYQYYRSYVLIDDLSRMADRAEKYVGTPYGSVFNTMREVPNKFICSSLVWYCAKMEYDVDISNGSRKYVWPSDILKDSDTYIKTEYK